ncbi:hypothetical protein [Streptosporangium saharense]|uniref:Uncharacterized protein n=1 Tax=Streptosporangium saharense TaxID=1706840 RepID=A0A7W7QPM8_9ACTN|nr:hypothetical protein [Streptosporangium saharense]MBB4917417.1 hypothetical protein [Streptosporangium saharense]
MIPTLLTAASRVVRDAGDLPPLVVSLLADDEDAQAVEAGAEVIPPSMVLIAPCVEVTAAEQLAVVHAFAHAQGWEVSQPDDWWETSGQVDGVRVLVQSVSSFGYVSDPRSPSASTVAHADLLAALIPWAAELPAREIGLFQVAELPTGLEVRLEVSTDGMRLISDKYGPWESSKTHVPWLGSGERADYGSAWMRGTTPTAHPLKVSTSW